MTMPGKAAARTASPEVMRRLLRSALRRARVDAGITQKDAAERLAWSPSKIIRIEQGTVPVAPSDARVLLLEYGVDEPRTTELVDLARASRRPDEWAAYKNVLSPEAIQLFANERAATVIQKYEPSVVPGLLQTEEYARALLKALGTPAALLKDRVEVRLRRQDLLDSPDCPDLDFIIGEAAVSRPVSRQASRPADADRIMLDQIAHLKELAKHPHVTLQLLPFAAGVHQGIGSAFTLLQFDDADLPDLLYLEDADKESVTRDDKEEIARYSERFVDLKELSSADDLDELLDRVAAYRFVR